MCMLVMNAIMNHQYHCCTGYTCLMQCVARCVCVCVCVCVRASLGDDKQSVGRMNILNFPVSRGEVLVRNCWQTKRKEED